MGDGGSTGRGLSLRELSVGNLEGGSFIGDPERYAK